MHISVFVVDFGFLNFGLLLINLFSIVFISLGNFLFAFRADLVDILFRLEFCTPICSIGPFAWFSPHYLFIIV